MTAHRPRTRPTRPRFLLLLGTVAGSVALPELGPVAEAEAVGSAGGRVPLIRPRTLRPVALWGSSSMAGGLSAEGTARPVDICGCLRDALRPVPVHQNAVGGQTSRHTAIASGAVRPAVRLPAGYTGGRVRVTIDTDATPQRTLRMPGRIGGGPAGLLTADGTGFFFEDAPVTDAGRHAATEWARERLEDGCFLTQAAVTAQSCRHVIWAGKNNIREPRRVLADVDLIRDQAEDPGRDCLVLGQWPAGQDRPGTATRAGIDEVNAQQSARYGTGFLDVMALLTSEEGLTSAPVRSLRLLERADVRADLADGVAPRVLRGHDGMHLNGWGNLLVSWALLHRMRDLRWL